MEKILKILKLSLKFSTENFYGYVKAMLKYIVSGAIGFIFLPLSQINPIFILFALFITIPLFCYSFWRGYVTTYAINFACFEFYNNKPLRDFVQYVELAKKQEKGLIGFVSFIAIITILAYIPGTVNFLQNLSLESIMVDPANYKLDSKTIMMFTISTIIFAQFINFSLQAYFFRKKENYFALSVNCYRNTGFSGFIISNIIVGLVCYLNCQLPIVYILIFMPLNLIIYSFNLFWYFEGMKKKLLNKK